LDIHSPASFQRKLETSNFSDVDFGKIERHNFLGRDIQKDLQSYDKNFPVNKTWVVSSAGMTTVCEDYLRLKLRNIYQRTYLENYY
jgi:hypothetical protein